METRCECVGWLVWDRLAGLTSVVPFLVVTRDTLGPFGVLS